MKIAQSKSFRWSNFGMKVVFFFKFSIVILLNLEKNFDFVQRNLSYKNTLALMVETIKV